MAIDITKLSDEDLSKKINSAKVAVERNTGLIKEASERKLKKLEAEVESRVKDVTKDVKKVEKKVETKAKAVKKDVKKDLEKGLSKFKAIAKKSKDIEEFKAEVRKIKDVPSEISAYFKKEYGGKEATIDAATLNFFNKHKSKTTTKVDAPKKESKKKPRVYGSPTEKFELTIDGKVYKFSDLASKEACEKATKAVAARYKEVKAHRISTKAGIEKASTIPVTKRISDGFASIAKKAVSEVPKTKIDKNPEDIKKELEAVEKAFDTLFDKLGALMGKDIPKSQRKQIMDILTKFEAKVEKGIDKKSSATSAVRKKKEDGGLAGMGDGGDMFGAGNSWSYISLM